MNWKAHREEYIAAALLVAYGLGPRHGAVGEDIHRILAFTALAMTAYVPMICWATLSETKRVLWCIAFGMALAIMLAHPQWTETPYCGPQGCGSE